MLAAVNTDLSVEDFQNEFNLKGAIYAVVNVRNTVTTDTIVHAWHNLWLETMFSDDEQDGNFEGFYMSSEKKCLTFLHMQEIYFQSLLAERSEY